GLERMQTLLSALGHPEYGQRFVHVAGTNGKGSTCAIIASVLTEAGYRTGLYTSPHLIEPTERIQINGQPVSDAEFAAAFDTVHKAAEDLLQENRIDAHPSYFETVTAMAFLLFRERCQMGVIEVGLGGRLDATNVIGPELCVITPISFDHESFLGNSLELIAGEKAGILKPNVPLVLSRQPAPAQAVIQKRAAELAVPITKTADIDLSNIELTPQGCSFEAEGVRYACPLPGRHQIDNAMTAIKACQHLHIEPGYIQRGLQKTRWPGRLEYASHCPDFVLDGAHNPAGAAALADYIQEFCKERPVWIVYGAMRDKAIEEVTGQLFPLADRLILTAPHFPRALRPEAIAEITFHPNTTVTQSVQEAIEIARTAPRDAFVFFTGSLFVVGEARAALISATRTMKTS
ncbi:MAG: bifunctional folylpolyglutamate synthase/dihydrofolate synthase, partial [Acidobacteria bacterium]|nr:bifunctional folylpolyglutamate synthase/dihydrofolate synthase [Acidobacteriota bacterium]